MRRILVGGLLVAAACGGHGSAAPGNGATGASSPRAAVEAFLSATRAGDLQALSTVWGSEEGPMRDRVKPDELEKRELIMMCYFKADDHEILSERAGQRNERALAVRLTKNREAKETVFATVRGPGERWYVVNADVTPVKEFCQNSPGR